MCFLDSAENASGECNQNERHLCVHRGKEDHVDFGKESASVANNDFLERRERIINQANQWNLANGGSQEISAAVDQINAQQVLANAASRATSVTVSSKGNSQAFINGTGNTRSAKQVPKRLSIRPPDNLKPGGEANFTTVNQLDYAQRYTDNYADGTLQYQNATAAETQQDSWNHRQIPRTQLIKNPDSLDLSRPFSLEAARKQDLPENAYHNKAAEYAQRYVENYANGTLQYQNATAAETQQDSWNHRQIPRTQLIKNPDSLALSGPFSVETTNKQDFPENAFQNKAADYAQGETTHRPRTSLKLSGDFQSDSSYQRAFTAKHAEDVFKVKKGAITQGNLKPEGDMTFDTTSLDYNAAVNEQMKRDLESDHGVALKPKLIKPQSGIKIPDVPLQDETTAVTDYRKWSVEKPERYKPSDTFKLGDGTSEAEEYASKLSAKVYSDADERTNDARWRVSRPVLNKPQNNLTTEGNFNFATSNDVDFSSRRARYSQSNLETLTERSEREPTEIATEAEIISKENQIALADREKATNIEESLHSVGQRRPGAVSTEVLQSDASPKAVSPLPQVTEAETNIPQSEKHTQYETRSDDVDYVSQNGEQMQYLTWDQIRPKPIRPHSNLRQEGGMEFSTTNRSEFIQKASERVKGIRPKTTTKVSEGNFDATTMNQIMFHHDQAERVNPIRPKNNLSLEDGQFEDETTTAREYQQWEIKRPSPIIHKSNLAQEGAIDFTTTNKTEFEEKHPEKVYPIRPTTTNRISGDHYLTTTNQVMHGSFPIERVQKIVPQSNLRTSSGAFNSETTNRTQFQEYQIDRPKPIRPTSNLHQEGSMDFTTMNQLQFEGKQIEKVTQFRPQSSSKVTGAFDGTTTNQTMYRNVPGEKPQAVRPKNNIQLEKGDFGGETTNNKEFQSWSYEKPTPIKPHSSIRQEGTMDFTTTNNTQFEGKTSERVEQIRPTTSTKISGDFDGTTMNQVMYQNNPLDTVRGIRPSTNIHLENGRFENQTTARREYQQWQIAKAEPIRPSGTLVQEGTMDFTTSNQTEFAQKPITKTEQIRPHTTSPITGEFDGTTTNQVMYQAQLIDKVHDIRPQDNLRVHSGEFKTGNKDFDYVTSNQSQYEEKTIDRVSKIRPKTHTKISDGKFDGTTTNQVMYQAQTIDKVHDIRPHDNLRVHSGEFKNNSSDNDFVTSNQLQYEEKSIDRVSKIRPNTHTKMSDGEFYGKTTNQAMFQAPEMETVHSVRPLTNLRVSEANFQGNTTVTDAYQQWKAERPLAYQQTTSLKQEGDMSFETTNNSEFKQKAFERVQQIRPKTSSKIGGDFEATTTNQAMFHQPGKSDRAKPIRHQNNLQLEHGKFLGETTTNREYKQWVKMENQIAIPKKKLQAAGVRTQRERPSRKREATKLQEKDRNSKTKENEREIRRVAEAEQETSDVKNINSSEIVTDTSPTVEKTQIPMNSAEQIPEKEEMAVQELSMGTKVGAEKSKISNDVSTMKADYGGEQGTKTESIVPPSTLSQKGDMNFTTTSKHDYNQLAITSVNSNQNQQHQQSVAEETSRNENYESWTLAAKEGKSLNRMTNAAANDSQTLRQEEQISSIKQNMKAPKRYKPQDNLILEHVPFSGTSTTRTEYKKREGRRSSSKRRGGNLKQEGRMEFDTTSNDYSVQRDYQMGRDSIRSKIKDEIKKGTLAPTGSMDFSTTSKVSYVGSKANYVGKAKNLRPRSSLRLGISDPSNQEMMTSSRSNPEISSTHENHDLTSTSRASYVGYTGTRTRANRPSTSQKVGGGAFDGQSTTRSSFTKPQENVPKSRALRPENHNILDVQNGLTGNTTYKSSFESKKGHCPVLDLEAGRSQLTFNEEKNGHLFYAPRVQG